MIEQHCTNWKYLIQEGCVSPGDGLPIKSTQVQGQDVRLFRPPSSRDMVWLQPCEAYKVGYKRVLIEGEIAHPLADQQVTSAVRDEEQTRRNIDLCAALAMKHGYRISLQLHKYLNLP